MRGIDYTLSCLPKARAFIAGAAILAGAFTSAAHGQTPASGNGKGTPRPHDEAAYAAPRVPHRAAPEVAFPQPLTPGDVALMRRIFAFQAPGTFRRQFDRARNWKIRYCSEPCSPTATSAVFIARPRMSYPTGCRGIAIYRTRRRFTLCCWPSCRTRPAHHRHRTPRLPAVSANLTPHRKISTRQETIWSAIRCLIGVFSTVHSEGTGPRLCG